MWTSDAKPERVLHFRKPDLGLSAVLVIDSTKRGPGVGGIRTRAYVDEAGMERDARALARSMTLKCALADLSAGGAKAVVRLTSDLDRAGAFRALGEWIQSLEGVFRTAGDLGTTDEDLANVAAHTEFVHTNTSDLGASVALSHGVTLRSALREAKLESTGLSAAIQGLGTIGYAIGTRLHAQGFALSVADLDAEKTKRAEREWNARAVSPSAVLEDRADVLVPSALGGVIATDLAAKLQARIVCGGANGILESEQAGEALRTRGIVFVPDVLSSAGAVIDGIGETVMGLSDRTPLIEALESTTDEVFELAREDRVTSSRAAKRIAWNRLAAPVVAP